MQKSRQQPKKQKRAPKRSEITSLYRNPAKSYRGQLVQPAQYVWGKFFPLTAAASVLATTVSGDPVSGVLGWAGRFQAIWNEYRVLAIQFHSHIAPYAAANGYATVVGFLDEKSNAAPTANEAREVNPEFVTTMPNSGDVVKNIITWRAVDLNDLGFSATTTGINIVWAKYYSDITAAELSSNFYAAAAGIGNVRPRFLIEFRGLKST
jgi:hypothetical protein